MHRWYLVAVLALFAQWTHGKICTTAEAKAAEFGSSTLGSWPEIYRAYKLYSHCDDGAIAEGFTQSVVHQFASNWSTVEDAARIARRDHRFERFIVRHIDGSADGRELSLITDLSNHHCPIAAESLCKKLARAAHVF